MPGNICFGCGQDNHQGLQIKSSWQDNIALCNWTPEKKYSGWPGLLNGGVIATLIDCHCMCTAMAAAYKAEGRALSSEPQYRYATGTLSIKYEKPTTLEPLELKAEVVEMKGRKATLLCSVHQNNKRTAIAEVIALRVYDSSNVDESSAFGSEKS